MNDAGALITDPVLYEAPNDDNICPAGTDLEGVYVTDPTTDCNIFATCTATSPLGVSLGLTTGQTVEVADAQLCNLAVPKLAQCGPTTNLPNALVTDLRLCNTATDANICPTTAGIDLPGVYVDNPTTQCNIFDTCDFNDPLGEALGLTMGQTVEVADEQLCDLSVPQVEECPDTTELGGVYVNNAATDCNGVDIAKNAEAQCLKCGDLAVFTAVGSPRNTANDLAAIIATAGELRGVPIPPATATNTNIFTVCGDPATAKTEFAARVTSTAVETAFNACLDNAAANIATSSLVQGQAASLQENSFTTNVKPEAEIPSFNTEPQNSDLNSLFENPHVKSLLQNPNLNALLENPDENALLQHPDVKALLEDPDVNALLETQR